MGIQRTGCEIIGILKKFKDADPADFHHAPEWKEREKSRNPKLRSRLLMWRSSPESMRDGLENVYMLLFWFVGNGWNAGWLATRESVVLVPDPIVLAPWSVLLDRGEPCDSCQDTPDEAASACFLSQASEEWRVTTETRSICARSQRGESEDDTGGTVPRTITSPPAG